MKSTLPKFDPKIHSSFGLLPTWRSYTSVLASDMSTLKDRFLEAEGFLSANKIQMTEALKLKLYGLSKQIKEGDCKMPQPPRYFYIMFLSLRLFMLSSVPTLSFVPSGKTG